jgi:hypothetical protein
MRTVFRKTRMDNQSTTDNIGSAKQARYERLAASDRSHPEEKGIAGNLSETE